jgi:hypothetical protein
LGKYAQPTYYRTRRNPLCTRGAFGGGDNIIIYVNFQSPFCLNCKDLPCKKKDATIKEKAFINGGSLICHMAAV